MKLMRLIKDIADSVKVKGTKDVTIQGIAIDSRRVAPGDIFIARKGESFDGADFIHLAVAAGASAIVTEVYNPFIKVTQVIGNVDHAMERALAETFFGKDAKKVQLIGVTGTNGKTTTTSLIHHILKSAGIKCGSITTLEVNTGRRIFQNDLTTPQLISNYKYIAEMHKNGCTHACLEVSSHALTLGRVDGINFDLSVITNLSQDHLDFHGSIEAYISAKASLFEKHTKHFAVINTDDAYAARFIEVSQHLKIVGCSIEKEGDFEAHDIVYCETTTLFTLRNKNASIRVETPLLGKHNVRNTLSAIAACSVYLDIEVIVNSLKNFEAPRGRLEKVQDIGNLSIFIDFAHTEEALLQTIQALKVATMKKVCVVFGAGGNRDSSKRKNMGKAASTADYCIITSDNPRNENPDAIIGMIEKGMESLQYEVIPDRRLAIAKSVEFARDGYVVVIAGKGHETVQLLSNTREQFSDYSVVKEVACG